jgi:hypothetical protein
MPRNRSESGPARLRHRDVDSPSQNPDDRMGFDCPVLSLDSVLPSFRGHAELGDLISNSSEQPDSNDDPRRTRSSSVWCLQTSEQAGAPAANRQTMTNSRGWCSQTL